MKQEEIQTLQQQSSREICLQDENNRLISEVDELRLQLGRVKESSLISDYHVGSDQGLEAMRNEMKILQDENSILRQENDYLKGWANVFSTH